MHTKEELRRNVLALRESLSRDEVKSRSRKIQEVVLELECFQKAKTIMCYISFRNEVDTAELIRQGLLMGKQMCAPRIRGGEIVPYSLSGDVTALKTGKFGLLEPDEEKENPVCPQSIDLVIVPGIAFDTKGNRVGFGKAYFDKFLPKLRKDAIKVALAYNFQVFDKVPAGPGDVRVDLIATDAGLIDCRGS